PVPGVAWRTTGATYWILTALQLAGGWLTLRSAAVLDVLDLAGVRRRAQPAVFKTAGAYGWVRHPIYSGWFLIVFAAPVMTMTRLVFAIVSGAYLLLAIPLEERSLRALPGGSYTEYARRVRWKLIPGVY